MTNEYLEAAEVMGSDEEGEFIRVEVTGKSAAQIEAVRLALEATMVGKVYQLARHQCNHDEGKSCLVEVL